MSNSQQARESEQAAGATAPPTSRPQDIMLLAFLREHDADCPVCGYNVRALTQPVCPECKQELVLTVGVAKLRLGWLLAALAPGFFSGIAACFVLIPIIGMFLNTRTTAPLVVALDLFGWCSGVFAIILARKRSRFLAQSRSRQRWFALTIWMIHIGAFVMFLLFATVFF